MPIYKYFAVVGSALLVFLFVTDTYFGDNESNSRFNGSLYESAIYAPRLEETAATAELRFTRMSRLPIALRRCSPNSCPTKVSAGNVTPSLLRFGNAGSRCKDGYPQCPHPPSPSSVAKPVSVK
jgi:hypothetical protein